jgi:hypothetical protein
MTYASYNISPKAVCFHIIYFKSTNVFKVLRRVWLNLCRSEYQYKVVYFHIIYFKSKYLKY